MLINLGSHQSFEFTRCIRHHSSSSVQAFFPSLAPERLIASEAGVRTTIILALLGIADLKAAVLVIVYCWIYLHCASQRLRSSLTFGLKCRRSRSCGKGFKVIREFWIDTRWHIILTYLWPSFWWLCGVRCCELWGLHWRVLGRWADKASALDIGHQNSTLRLTVLTCLAWRISLCHFNLACLSLSCDFVPGVDLTGLKPGCMWVDEVIAVIHMMGKRSTIAEGYLTSTSNGDGFKNPNRDPSLTTRICT